MASSVCNVVFQVVLLDSELFKVGIYIDPIAYVFELMFVVMNDIRPSRSLCVLVILMSCPAKVAEPFAFCSVFEKIPLRFKCFLYFSSICHPLVSCSSNMFEFWYRCFKACRFSFEAMPLFTFREVMVISSKSGVVSTM